MAENEFVLLIPELPGIPVRVIRKRQKNAYLRVRENGEPVITAPLRSSKAYLREFLGSHADWVLKQIGEKRDRQTHFEPEKPGEREALRKLLEDYIRFWEPRMGVRSSGFRIRSMKTRWGSCNPVTGSMTFNLQLIRYPESCAEYVVVHELAHLKERGHNPRFWGIVEKALPDYKARKKLLE